MSSLALKLLKKHAKKKLKDDERDTNADNILYTWEPVPGKKKPKRTERKIWDGLSRNDQKILKHVRRKAYYWDQSFTCCCGLFKFGWSAVIGLIPVIGDAIELMMSLSLVRKASKIDGGLPGKLRFFMYLNIALDFAIGFVPIVGDLIDVFYRANTRNAWLLDSYLQVKAEALRPRNGRQPGFIYDPDDPKIKAPVPPEWLGGDEEQGVAPAMAEPARATPTVVPPARTPAARLDQAPPGRTLTPQRPSGGRHAKDPRDRSRR